MLPLALPLLRGAPPPAGQSYAAGVLMLAGTGWAVWSLRYLGRSLSVIAQARQVAAGGPYRWVRHPLYTGEIVSALGLALAAGSAAALAAWLAFGALQAYRALREEQILLRALPGYGSYRAATAALFPVPARRRR
jgi:protein-S-isoprenylcysteine O-methyltransferase Ste14